MALIVALRLQRVDGNVGFHNAGLDFELGWIVAKIMVVIGPLVDRSRLSNSC